MDKTISIFSRDHAIYKYWAKQIMDNFSGFRPAYYSGADEKDFLEGFKSQPSDVAVIFRMAESEDDHNVRRFVRELRTASKKSKIIAVDLLPFFGSYVEAGADFIIKVGDVRSEAGVIKKLISGDRLDEKDSGLVYEKKEFYDYVAENSMFDDRAKQTAYKGAELNSIALNLVFNHCRTVLDVGCGNGRLSVPLAELGFDVAGIDISEKLIRKAVNNSNGINPRFIVGDILHPPFAHTVKFDAVLMMWHVICEFRSRRNEALRNVYSLLRPKGLLIFDFPDRAKNVEISRQGVYSSKVDSGFKKYLGLVPDVKNIVETLEHLGFDYVCYKRLKWGIHKFCVIARKHG